MDDQLSTPEQLRKELEALRKLNEKLTAQLAQNRIELHTCKENEKGLKDLLKNTSQIKDILDQNSIVILTDRDGIIIYVNDNFCELCQFSRQELLGKNIDIINSNYHSKPFFSHLWQTISEGGMWKGEIRNKAKDGSYFWIDMVITPLLDEHGNIKEYLAIRKNITPNKQAEAKMRFDAHILSHVTDAVVGLDANYQINYWNQGAQRQYGLAAWEVLGKPLTEVYESIWINPEDEIKARHSLARRGYCTVEIKHKLKNGQELYVEATTQILLNETEESVGLLAVIRDISERKKAEDTLKNTLKELENRNYELDNYVYKASHDLRAPLTSIQGLLNLIKQETNQEAIQQYLNLIEGRILKLDEHIQAILNHSQILNAEITITKIDFEKLIHICFEDLQYYNNWEKLHLSVQIINDADFYSDEFKIIVVLRNIISNAVKYLNVYAKHCYLEFKISITHTKAYITASDNGIGIDQAYLAKIFNMFFRASPTSNGSGLGLYIVKQAIEKLNGRIKVESKKGAGTTFSIELPNFNT